MPAENEKKIVLQPKVRLAIHILKMSVEESIRITSCDVEWGDVLRASETITRREQGQKQ